MKKLSIIMPCYNAEAVIDRTLETLTEQSLGIEMMEIILVDDASTDGTFVKLCEWEKRFPESILVVHCEKNGRQGCARNIGLSYASGEFVGFVDDDDMVSPFMYQVLYENAKKYGADCVICQSRKCTIEQYEDLKNQTTEAQKEAGGGKIHIFTIDNTKRRRQFLEQDYNIAIWNKIYKRTMLMEHGILFLEDMIYDDIYFSGLVKQYVERVVVLNQEYYYHIISDTNVSYGNKDKKQVYGYIEAWLKLLEDLEKRGKKQLFEEFYRDEFLVSYLAFIHSYCRQFGYLEIPVWNRLKLEIEKRIPDMEESQLWKVPFKNKVTEVIAESLFQKIDAPYILKLVQEMEKELISEVCVK